MSRSSLATALGELEKIQSQLRLMDAVRTAVANAGGRLQMIEPPACALTHFDTQLLDNAFSRRSDHYLTYAAGYAVLESFINEIVKSVLRFYERSGNYADLPQKTKTALRVGTARVLDRINWRRFSHLSELGVVQSYYAALSGSRLEFSDDVIISSEANYRSEEIREVFSKCGLGEVWGRVKSDPEVVDFLLNTILEDNTLDSVLSMIVGRRNEVAHGVVKAIDGTEILLEVLDFLKILFKAVVRSTVKQFLLLIDSRGRVRKIGQIKERFRGRIGIVELDSKERISKDDTLIVRRGGKLELRSVKTLQLDGIEIASCRGSAHLQLGVDFGEAISRQGDFFALSDPLDEDLICT